MVITYILSSLHACMHTDTHTHTHRRTSQHRMSATHTKEASVVFNQNVHDHKRLWVAMW